MRCPFRINEVHDVSACDVTKVNMEYAECYQGQCPYFKRYHGADLCLKVQAEVSNGQKNS